MNRPCSTCPFRKNAKEVGAGDWLLDVLKMFFNRAAKHTCHKTDPKADLYRSGNPKACVGFDQMRMNVRLNGNAYPDVFKTLRDFMVFHGIPNLERAEKEGYGSDLTRRALRQMKGAS